MRMKKWKLVAVVLTAAVMFAGCGKASSSSSSSQQTRTIKTAKGNVKVPVHPKRVVSTVYTGEILSLGFM